MDEFRFKRDFLGHLKRVIDNRGLAKFVEFIEVRNHFSKKIQEVTEERKKIEIIKKWNKKIKAHFLIWGEVKRRKDEGGKLFLSLDSIVYHKPIPLGISFRFRREILEVFPREINFLERFELKGFEISAELVSLAAQNIIGTAAFISGDPFLALDLHFNFLKGLEYTFKGLKELPPNFRASRKKVIKMISGEFSTLSRYYYYAKKDLDRTYKFANKSLEFNKENYTAYLLLAIFHFLKNRDIKKALEMIELASKYSNGDMGWKYSEAFLHCYNGDLETSKKCYSAAFRGRPLESERFLRDIVSFIEDILSLEPDKFQLHYALGRIYYQKLYNLPMALENYEKFLEGQSKNPNPNFSRIAETLKEYVERIKGELDRGF